MAIKTAKKDITLKSFPEEITDILRRHQPKAFFLENERDWLFMIRGVLLKPF